MEKTEEKPAEKPVEEPKKVTSPLNVDDDEDIFAVPASKPKSNAPNLDDYDDIFAGPPAKTESKPSKVDNDTDDIFASSKPASKPAPAAKVCARLCEFCLFVRNRCLFSLAQLKAQCEHVGRLEIVLLRCVD